MTEPNDATLLDLLVDGFEKDEGFDGFHYRLLPMPDTATAARKFADLVDEGTRWKGEPICHHETTSRRRATWGQLEIRQLTAA